MKDENIKRVKDILKGNFTETTKILVTKSDKTKKYVEGDVWIDNNKEWTIKNGIKISKSKLQTARDKYKIPLTCPKCNKSLKGFANREMYKHRNMCLNCVTEEDTQYIIDGTLKERHQEKINKNIDAYLRDFKAQIDEYINTFDSSTYITDMGDIEDWDIGLSKEEIKTKLYAEYDKFEKQLKK